VTLLYALGYLWAGALLALIVGVLDGVDGKLARLKVHMTKSGKGEHLLDYVVEMSWWMALAYHFHATGQVRYAYVILLVFLAFISLERVARGFVQRRIGRSLNDFSRSSGAALQLSIERYLKNQRQLPARFGRFGENPSFTGRAKSAFYPRISCTKPIVKPALPATNQNTKRRGLFCINVMLNARLTGIKSRQYDICSTKTSLLRKIEPTANAIPVRR
jgi:hypothetical protein